METIGLMPSADGKPGGKRIGQKMADYIIPGGKLDQVLNIICGNCGENFDEV